MTARLSAPALPWGRISDALSSGLILIDGQGAVVHWNAWIERYSGIPAEHALGLTMDAIFGDALTAPFKRALDNVQRHGLPVVLSNVLHRFPLPLYHQPAHAAPSSPSLARMPQSLVLMPVADDEGGHLCLIQVTDTSLFVKRERLLQSNSDRLSKEAVVDGLTGVYNRKYFNEKLPVEVSRAVRGNASVSLLMLDVDCFKNYNDSYGHPAGDRTLLALVAAAQAQLNRATDILARYGGEEFAVILSACDQAGALRVAEKIRLAVVALALPHVRSDVAAHITVSIGAATCGPGDFGTPEDLLETGDRALYEAKRGGRNAVCWLPIGAAKPGGAMPTTA